MRLLLFNLVTNADDPVLGFTTRWIGALASRLQFVHVLTMSAGRLELPANVRVQSAGKEKGFSEPRRLLEFYRRLLRILHDDRIDVCFSHMIPIFTALASPLLKWRGIPIVHWQAHPTLTWTLRLAHSASDRVVTSLRSAYPYHADKLAVIGQGIDTDLFCANGDAREDPSTILCVGRLSRVKRLEILLEAAALLRSRAGCQFRLVFLGAAVTEDDLAYRLSLHERTRSLGLADRVAFEPPVSYPALPRWYRRSAVHVNLTPVGFGDKVAWEAMACERPSLVANEEFRETLGAHAEELLFRGPDPADLAEKLRSLLRRSEPERKVMGRYLRRQVIENHSLDHLASTLVGLFEGLLSRR